MASAVIVVPVPLAPVMNVRFSKTRGAASGGNGEATFFRVLFVCFVDIIRSLVSGGCSGSGLLGQKAPEVVVAGQVLVAGDSGCDGMDDVPEVRDLPAFRPLGAGL